METLVGIGVGWKLRELFTRWFGLEEVIDLILRHQIGLVPRVVKTSGGFLAGATACLGR
jgi:hypothetical protein